MKSAFDSPVFVCCRPEIESRVRLALNQAGVEDFIYFRNYEGLCDQAGKRQSCNLLISDIDMPMNHGVKAVQEVRKHNDHVAVIALAGHGDFARAFEDIGAGISDVISHDNVHTELPLCLDRLLHYYRFRSNNVFSRLSKAEVRVLNLVVKGLSNKDIAEKMNRSIRTIEDHRSKLMKKTDSENLVDLIKKACQAGFI